MKRMNHSILVFPGRQRSNYWNIENLADSDSIYAEIEFKFSLSSVDQFLLKIVSSTNEDSNLRKHFFGFAHVFVVSLNEKKYGSLKLSI